MTDILSPARLRSPLRYPGGKSRAARMIADIIPHTESRLCAPFFGGGSVELELSQRMTVSGFDSFVPLVDFWHSLIEDPADLARRVRLYHPIDRETFYKLQKEISETLSRRDRAAIFFVINRSSFSGVSLAGGFSPGAPRFTESAIRRLETFRAPETLSVSLGDFRDVIPAHGEDFLYLDPPYMINQGLYGVKGRSHRGFDHKALFDLLEKRDRWILSYNDSPEIREIYKGYRIESLSWVYGMGKDKKSREVIIFSKEFIK
jgi:DNA adenine methylase